MVLKILVQLLAKLYLLHYVCQFRYGTHAHRFRGIPITKWMFVIVERYTMIVSSKHVSKKSCML